MIEVILDGRFVAAGDKQNLLDTVADQFFDHVLHDRLAGHGQHFFRLRFGGGSSRVPIPATGTMALFITPLTIPSNSLYIGEEEANGCAFGTWTVMDISGQLEELRRTVARSIASTSNPHRRGPRRQRGVEEVLNGTVVSTAYGEHFETERVWERHRRHGCVGISDLGICRTICWILSPPVTFRAAPRTLGFPGHGDYRPHGRCGYLRVPDRRGTRDAAGFRLRQFFMRDFGEESSLLDSWPNTSPSSTC